MKLSEIIKKYRKEHDLSQRQMGARCGLSTGYISLIEKEINPQTGKLMVPSLPVMNKIAKGMNLTLDDLLAVCDNMDVNLSDKETIVSAPTAERDIDPIYDALNIAGRQALCAYGRFLGSQTEYRAPEEPSAAPSRIIPLLGASFAAGTSETPGDLFIQDYATTDPHAEFAIRVNGNSMEPYLADGSIALGVKRAPRDGEVGAFWLDGGFLVKQVCQDHIGNTYLFSLNRDRADADETIWHDSDRDLRLIGTILMSQRLPLP